VPRGVTARRADLDATGAGIETTRADLIDAAARIFAARGYHHTTVEDVVAEAGVAKGTVYWYWRSKKALFLAVLERAAAVYRDELVREAAGARSALDRLGRAVDGTMAFARRRPDLCRLYFQPVNLDDDAFVARRSAIYAGLIDDLRVTIRDAVRAGELPRQDVEGSARMVVGAVEAAVRASLDGDGRRLDRAGLRAFVTGGLRGAR